MPKGGARPGSGPAPDPNALRRDRPSDRDGWTTLPAAERTSPAPPWPLAGQSDREADVWDIYWRKPIAELWARNGQEFEVAIHVRSLIEAEESGAPTNLRTLVQQQMNSLLLTLPAMRSARVKFSSDELGQKREERTASTGSRSRVSVVKADGA